MSFSKKKLWTLIDESKQGDALDLISSCPDVNDVYVGFENEYGKTFLHHALDLCLPEVCIELLNKGADASILDFKGHSCLFYFFKSELYDHPELLKKLIKSGANVNERVDGYSLLYLVLMKMPEMVSFLLDCKVDVHAKPFVESARTELFFDKDVVLYRYESYISLSIIKNDKKSFLRFIKISDFINIQNSQLQTPAMVAALYKNDEMLSLLINKGASFDVKDCWDRTLNDYLSNMISSRYKSIAVSQEQHNRLLLLQQNVGPVIEKMNIQLNCEEDTSIKTSFWHKIKKYFRIKG